jgi:hypothetical protein
MDSRIGHTLLERNPRTAVRAGCGPLRHHIAVPEPVFVQEMRTVAQARFGADLDRLPSPIQEAIEADLSDPLRWSAHPNYHLQGCPACAESSF